MLLTDQNDLFLWSAKATIRSIENNEILVETANDHRRIEGVLTVSVRPNSLQVINRMPTEVYILGVIEPELGSLNFPVDSLRAQIIACRTYTMAMRGRHASQGYDFCDGPHCQTFRGIDRIQPSLVVANAAVHGQYLSYGGRPIPAFYHDNCGGMTAAADQVWPMASRPYLKAVKDGNAEDVYCRYAPRARWTFQADYPSLRKILIREGLLARRKPLYNIRIVRTDVSGRAQVIGLYSDRQLIRLPANSFRRLLNRSYGSEVLPSTLFTVSREGQRFIVAGRGWGHGVGLCQWGAIEMAREGKNYRQILQHYFPGTTLEEIPVPMYATGGVRREG